MIQGNHCVGLVMVCHIWDHSLFELGPLPCVWNTISCFKWEQWIRSTGRMIPKGWPLLWNARTYLPSYIRPWQYHRYQYLTEVMFGWLLLVAHVFGFVDGQEILCFDTFS
jgi:hypothetical protein